MRSPETFDAFYASSRDRLLHETYAMTGDAAASRAAVRDAFAVAWHHWRKVDALDDPEAWVRPIAHRWARRRHSTRLWHRDKSLDPDVRATLDALSRITGKQRHLIVLTTLSPLTLSAIAREAGLPRADAERELQTGTSQFALHRDLPTTAVRAAIEALRGPLSETRWPRATIVRRAGTARRRTHTLAGALLAAGALVASGSVVAGGAGAQVMSLSEENMTPGVSVRDTAADAETDVGLSEDALLAEDQVERFGRSLDWSETSTTDNLQGDGLVLPCQPERFADPDGLGALVRTWDGTAETVQKQRVRRKGKVRVRSKRVTTVQSQATEFVELSADAEQAQRAFETARSWYAACTDPRTQLVATHKVTGVGDSATLFRLRSWRANPASLTVGVARTGQVLVTTVVRSHARPVDDATASAALAAAVNGLCGSPGVTECAGRPRPRGRDPLPIAGAPLLGAVDLPPVQRARGPWVGTDPAPARTNFAATNCDRTSFRQKGIRRALTRTFLFPETPRADQFGLTQTVGTMPTRRAKGFVDQVRSRVRKCGAANLGTSVDVLAADVDKRRALVVYALSVEVSENRTVPFFMAILRDGKTVSQVGFSPDGQMTMSRPDFVGVARRALERLGDTPTG